MLRKKETDVRSKTVLLLKSSKGALLLVHYHICPNLGYKLALFILDSSLGSGGAVFPKVPGTPSVIFPVLLHKETALTEIRRVRPESTRTKVR